MEFLSALRGSDIIFQILIKSTVVLTLSLSFVFLFRKKSATLRHFVLSMSLICLLLLPVFSIFGRGWETRLLPSFSPQRSGDLLTNRTAGHLEFPLQPGSQSLSEDQGLLPASTTVGGEKFSNQDKTALPMGAAGFFLMAVWISGMIFFTVRIVLGLCGAFRLTRQGEKLSGPTWRRLMILFLEAVSIKRKIRLLSHKQVKVPLTWGIFKPVIIVPAETKSWTPDECSSALFHELSHIKRADFLVKILARLSCALYWFNPLGWAALRMMKKDQEKACDELVLKAGVKPSIYAANLLAIKKAGRMHWNPPSAALGAVGKSQLNERLVAILKQQFRPKEVNMKTKIVLSTLMIVSMAWIGLARPAVSSAQSEKGLKNDETIMAYAQPLAGDAAVQEKEQEKKKKEEAQKKKEAEKASKEKSEEKSEENKKVTWVTKDGKQIHIYITSDEEGEAKTIKVIGDMKIHVDKDSDEKTITLQLPSECLKLKKNEEGTWTIKADKMEMQHNFETGIVKIDKAHALKEKMNYAIKIDKEKGEKNYFFVKSPKLELKKSGKFDIHLAKPGVKFYFTPHSKAITYHNGEVYGLRNLGYDNQEINEKLEIIQEKLKQIREKKDIDQDKREAGLEEIEEMLKELSEKLKIKKEELKDVRLGIYTDAKKLDELKDLDISVHTDLEELKELHDVDISIHTDLKELEELKDVALHVSTSKIDLDDMKDVIVSIHSDDIKIEDLKGVAVSVHPDVEKIHIDHIDVIEKGEGEHAGIDLEANKTMVAVVDKEDGEYQIIIKSDLDDESRAHYEEAIANIKNKLPETYSVELDIDEDKGTVSITITGVEGDKDTKISIKEILAKIKGEISKIKKTPSL